MGYGEYPAEGHYPVAMNDDFCGLFSQVFFTVHLNSRLFSMLFTVFKHFILPFLFLIFISFLALGELPCECRCY